MSILLNPNTRVITQGMTGKTGTFHTEQTLAYSTGMFGRITPGEGRQTESVLPVFNAVKELLGARKNIDSSLA